MDAPPSRQGRVALRCVSALVLVRAPFLGFGVQAPSTLKRARAAARSLAREQAVMETSARRWAAVWAALAQGAVNLEPSRRHMAMEFCLGLTTRPRRQMGSDRAMTPARLRCHRQTSPSDTSVGPRLQGAASGSAATLIRKRSCWRKYHRSRWLARDRLTDCRCALACTVGVCVSQHKRMGTHVRARLHVSALGVRDMCCACVSAKLLPVVPRGWRSRSATLLAM